MQKSVLAILLLTLFHSLWACEVQDDRGQTLKLTHPAQRIISLAPDLTEILFAIGAGSHIVGVIKGSDYPAAAKNIPLVATFNSIDVEKILALHPDLIVGWVDGNITAPLKKLGIPLYLSHPHQFTDIPDTLKKLGCLTGTEKTATKAAQDFSKRYAALKIRYANQKKISVFYQVWHQPLITITQASWINDVIEVCGGKNIFAELTGPAPEVNQEAILLANPTVMISADSPSKMHAQWQAWPALTAVKKNHLLSINPDEIERAGPRLIEGATRLCKQLAIIRGEANANG